MRKEDEQCLEKMGVRVGVTVKAGRQSRFPSGREEDKAGEREGKAGGETGMVGRTRGRGRRIGRGRQMEERSEGVRGRETDKVDG